VVSATDPCGRILGISGPEPLLILPSSSSIVLTRLNWAPFQTHYFSENLVTPGIEPGPLDLKPGTLITRPQRQSRLAIKFK
jgi:hypothetical protein